MKWLGDGKRPWLWVTIVYGVLTLVYTYPLPLRMTTHLLGEGDAALMAWTIGWVGHQWLHDPLHIYDAPILYPHRYSLAFAESLLLPGLLGAPLLALTGNVILTANVLILLSFVLMGIATFALAYELSEHRVGSLLAGIMVAFCVYRYAHAARLQLLMGFWIPLCLLFVIRFFRTGRTACVGWAVACWVSQFLSCIYYGIFLTIALLVLLPVMSVIAWKEKTWTLQPRTISATVALVMAGIATVALFLYPYWILHRRYHLAASPGEVYRYSVTWSGYWPLQGWPLWVPASLGERDPNFIIPLAAYVLLVPALLHLRRWHVPMVVLAAVAAFLSFGGRNPASELLYDVFPPLQAIRAPSRWAFLVIIALGVLAAFGFRIISERRSRLFRGIAGLAVMLTFWGGWHGPMSTTSRWSQVPEVYRWLARMPPGPVLELPPWRWILEGIQYHFYTFHHRHPTIYGMVSYMPPSAFILVRMAREWPSYQTWFTLKELGFRYVVFHRDRLGPRWTHERIAQSLAPFRRWIRGITSIGTSTVVILNETTLAEDLPSRDQPRGVCVQDRRWRLQASFPTTEPLSRLLDGDPETVWSVRWPSPDAYLELDLGQPLWVYGITIMAWRHDHTPYYLETSSDGRRWRPVPTVSEGIWLNIPRIRALQPLILTDPGPFKTIIFPPRSYRWIRIYRRPRPWRYAVLYEIGVWTSSPSAEPCWWHPLTRQGLSHLAQYPRE